MTKRTWRERLRPRPRPPEPNRLAPRFVDPSAAKALADRGYAVLDQRLAPDVLDRLAALYAATMGAGAADRSGEFFPSMMLDDPEVRAQVWDGIEEITRESVEAIFEPGTMEAVGGLFVVKPASPDSARHPHQDATGFDETRYVVASVWISLTDSTVENGAIHVLPGSHRMGNFVRPRDVDSLDDEVRAIALAESVPVELAAGQMVVIDAGVIHHSPPNLTDRDRVAAICTLRHPGAQVEFVQSEQGAQSGTASRFGCDLAVFRTGDVTSSTLDPAALIARAAYGPATVADLDASRATAPG